MKKIGLVCLALVLALGALGVSYALWSDSLYLNGTVETGTIGLEWSQGVPYDVGDYKGVSDYYCSIVDNTLTITILNAYPCVEYHFPIDVHGIGSIPVHTSWMVTGGNIDPAWIMMPDWGQLQIHQGDEYLGEVVIHLDNSAEQGVIYTFSCELYYWQYNETPG